MTFAVWISNIRDTGLDKIRFHGPNRGFEPLNHPALPVSQHALPARQAEHDMVRKNEVPGADTNHKLHQQERVRDAATFLKHKNDHLLTPLTFTADAVVVTVPSALCATAWHSSVQVLVPRL